MLFNLSTKNVKIICVCNYAKTRNGFKHFGDVYLNDNPCKRNDKEIKCNYINRTWERFEYQSLLFKMIDFLKRNDFINNENYQELYNKIYNNELN